MKEKRFQNNTFTIIYILAIIVIAGMVIYFPHKDIFAAGSQERDVFASIYKSKTKACSFPLRNIDTNDPIPIDTTKDVVYFRVKKNTSDATYVINKTCTFAMKFAHEGVIGTLAKGDTVTGATSTATAIIGYVNTLESNIWLTNVSGTFVDGEQVYKTVNVNYVVLTDAGVHLAVTSLSTTDTNLAIGDYFAYVELVNTTNAEDEILLKSKYKVIQ